jgi:hypothetical protein
MSFINITVSLLTSVVRHKNCKFAENCQPSRHRKLASMHIGSCALTLGRLLASGWVGHENVPRDECPRGQKTSKVARQPA